jgi:signal transduction histidine kinase
MKKKTIVLLLGITPILILIAVQVFIMHKIWQQETELLTLRYTVHTQEAMAAINRRMQIDGFDTARMILNKYTSQAYKDLHSSSDTSVINSKKKEILTYVTKVVNQEQDLSALLSSYFQFRGFDKNFNIYIVIHDLEIVGDDTTVIYRSQYFANKRAQGPKPKAEPPQRTVESKILVNWFNFERDNYRLFFEYFIDFSDKRELVLKETFASLGLSSLSIILVGIMFMITFRNLLEERRLSNLKTDFINNMTHELKTPLSTITVAGRTLEMEQIRTNEEKILETAKLIGKQSVHLNQLINMILEISMWERTQFQLDKKTVDIEEFMKDVVESFKKGNGNGSSITQKYNLKGTKTDLDVVYFTTLVNNLLSNAVKYSDNSPVIDIEGYKADDKICFRFTDNGIGINKNDQKHVFDKFYRASTGNIHKFKGLGLGLYYVKKIAEAHGGDVTVNSKPGKGSTFTVTIPDS